MAEIINLRHARKARAKAEMAKTAEANRVLHGTPKALRNLARARKDKGDKALSGHTLDDKDDQNRSVGDSQSDKN
jgi:hypothetical protein